MFMASKSSCKSLVLELFFALLICFWKLLRKMCWLMALPSSVLVYCKFIFKVSLTLAFYLSLENCEGGLSNVERLCENVTIAGPFLLQASVISSGK